MAETDTTETGALEATGKKSKRDAAVDGKLVSLSKEGETIEVAEANVEQHLALGWS
jgi:hypothetical protein